MAVAQAARRPVELRYRWLNRPEWLGGQTVGYPTRPLPRDKTAANEIKARTLTNLYNACPQWLADARAKLV